ncbi:hypothetical protein F5Y06DRAFT_292319 [Hypoxylon sp. FL0890]|nr:hypothetical protein F5Y06DRAFT_292319 [Hypoxylon sp. FL0890]
MDKSNETGEKNVTDETCRKYPRVFQKPDHIFNRKLVAEDLTDEEFSVSQAFFHLTDIVINQYADLRHVGTFLKLRVIHQATVQSNNHYTPSSVQRHQEPNAWDRNSGVNPNYTDEPIFSGHFRHLTTNLYGYDVVEEPAFICLMHDTLEVTWEKPSGLVIPLQDIWYWLNQYSDRLSDETGRECWTNPELICHGPLYKLELDKTHGKLHPDPGLTLQRWRFWYRGI